MKKFSGILLIVFFLIIPMQSCYASSNEEMSQEQQEKFGIQDFLEEAQEYTGDFFEDMKIEDVFQGAVKGNIDNSSFFKRIFQLFGSEMVNTLKAIGSILAILVVHSVLKSIGESLENQNVSKLIYYVQYILIITIIMLNFSDIVKLVQDTTVNLVAFMNMLVPLLITLMISTGSIATSSVIEPIILFMINLIGNMIQNLLIPLILIFTSLIILSKLSDKVQIEKLATFLKSGVVWFLGIVLTIFVSTVSLEGTMATTVDRNYG